jgi:hypothetical protein
MSSPDRRLDDIATDLVAYLIVTVPDPAALVAVGAELVQITEAATIRVLDLAVVTLDADGRHHVVDVDGLQPMRDLAGCYGVLLSAHDLDLTALALNVGDYALVVVAEDRWAQPLASAARANGGEVRAGERIGRARVEAALARASFRQPTEE